jgi:hypothetical protein
MRRALMPPKSCPSARLSPARAQSIKKLIVRRVLTEDCEFKGQVGHDQTQDLARVIVTKVQCQTIHGMQRAHLGKQLHRPDRRFHIARLHSKACGVYIFIE